MIEQIKTFLKSFASCPQLARIYRHNHPEVGRAIQKSFADLKAILDKQPELVIAVVGDEIVSGEDIFFDLSRQLSVFIQLLTDRQISKLTFRAGLSPLEFKDFALFFLDPACEQIGIRDYLASKDIRNIVADKIRIESEDPDPEGLDSVELPGAEIYTESLAKVSASIESIVDDKSVNFANVYLAIDSLMKGLGMHYQEILKLSQVKGKDDFTYAHVLNVAMLSVYFAQYLGLPREEARNLGIAALFHDIGKLYLSNAILKGGKLTEQEFESIKSHSLLGSRILLSFVDNVGVLPAVVALEHHLKYDASGGYPQLQFAHPLHLGSQMVSLCDVYDALSQRRSYKNAYPPEEIYKIMKGGRGTQFDPELFDAFFAFMGVWPNGALVELSDGRVAMVAAQCPADRDTPDVEVLVDDACRMIALKDNPELTIVKSLNPLNEGKDHAEAFVRVKQKASQASASKPSSGI